MPGAIDATSASCSRCKTFRSPWASFETQPNQVKPKMAMSTAPPPKKKEDLSDLF